MIRLATWTRACAYIVALRMLPTRYLRATPFLSAAHPVEIEIGFVTDIEGDLTYFNRWVAESRVLRYGPDGNLDFVHSNARFVYGGDCIDRGDGDVRLLRLLVALKRSYPDRVSLLVGNRDLNKLRLSSELSSTDMARSPRDIPPPHWDASAPSLQQYLEKRAAERGTSVEGVDSRAERLRYMYAHTLGCPHTFEFRRAELAVVQGRHEASVTDDEVVTGDRKGFESPAFRSGVRCPAQHPLS